jgi:hypothetical protein
MSPNSYDGHTAITNPSGTATIHASKRQYQAARRFDAGGGSAAAPSPVGVAGPPPEAGRVTVTVPARDGTVPVLPRRGGGAGEPTPDALDAPAEVVAVSAVTSAGTSNF